MEENIQRMKQKIDKSTLSQMVVKFFDNELTTDQQPILLQHLKNSAEMRQMFDREGNVREWLKSNLKAPHNSKISPAYIKKKLGLN